MNYAGGTRTALHAPPATAAHASKALETCKVHLSPCMFRRQVEGACSHAGCGEGRLHCQKKSSGSPNPPSNLLPTSHTTPRLHGSACLQQCPSLQNLCSAAPCPLSQDNVHI
eukprot:1159282-Pelagomonas_calceolata.AAC.14